MATYKELRSEVEKVIDHTESLSDEDLVEIDRLYRLSSPIRIPVEKLNPEWEYRWVNRTPKVLRRRRGIGWSPVTMDDLERISLVPIDQLHMGTHPDADGHLAIGDDLVFCKISKRIAMALRKARERENRARLSMGKRLFHETGELAGVETYDKA